MCHNHSHARVIYTGTMILEGVAHYVWENRGTFVLEMPDGSKLTMPAGTIFLTPFWKEEDLPASVSPLMVVRAEFTPASDAGSKRNTGTPSSK